jgi:hypothetical protein
MPVPNNLTAGSPAPHLSGPEGPPYLGRNAALFRWVAPTTWRAFEHDQFAVAKASAYLSILTFFPRCWSWVGAGHAGAAGTLYLREVSYARIHPTRRIRDGDCLPAGTNQAGRILISTSLLTLWTASGTMISDGGRNLPAPASGGY